MAFEGVYTEIKMLRDRANACNAADEIIDVASDEANLSVRCAQGLKAEVLLRAILGQLATATEGL